MKHFIGIDNSTISHKVCILDENGNLKTSFSINNNYPGFEELNAKLHNYKDFCIACESTHGPLIDFLNAHHYSLYLLNALKVKRFKETFTVSGDKSDRIDAHAIGEYLRNHYTSSRTVLHDSSDIERLKRLSSMHHRITIDQTRLINKLHYAVRTYFPLHESLFSKFSCTTQLKLLMKYPTNQDLQRATEEELRDFLQKNKYCRKDWIDRLLKKIRNHVQLVAKETEEIYCFEALYLCEALMHIHFKLTSIEYLMNKITSNHPLGVCFQSLPGAGDILSSKLFALFGDNRKRFNYYNEAQSLFGTAPRNYQSGNYHKVIMRKMCNKKARVILYLFAFSSMRFAPWAREYYDKLRGKGKTHSVAIRALSNKWVKIMFSMWKNKTFYDENKKIDAVA